MIIATATATATAPAPATRLEVLGQRLDILSRILDEAISAERLGECEDEMNAFRLASVLVSREVLGLYNSASDEWKAEYDRVRLSR